MRRMDRYNDENTVTEKRSYKKDKRCSGKRKAVGGRCVRYTKRGRGYIGTGKLVHKYFAQSFNIIVFPL